MHEHHRRGLSARERLHGGNHPPARPAAEAGKTVKVEGKDNNLLELIAADPAFNLSLEDLQRSMDPKKYIGRAKEQTERFVNTVVQPILDSHKELLGVKAEINV